MKNKNRVSKVITGVIVSSVFSAAVGFALSSILDFTIKGIPISPVYFVLVFSMMATLLTFLILLRTETVEEYRYEVTQLLGDGFIRIYKDSISEFATTLVKRSKYIRVVGTARQDVISSRSMKGAQEYLRALEKRLAKPCDDTANRFTYLRVIPREVTGEMQQHVDKCEGLAKSKGHKFQCKSDMHFPFYVSFQTFDDTDLLIILDNMGTDKKHDNEICLWTRNKKIINVFIKRFDNGWYESEQKKSP